MNRGLVIGRLPERRAMVTPPRMPAGETPLHQATSEPA
jgi:hypothetical protein